jgi:hypothetical protein
MKLFLVLGFSIAIVLALYIFHPELFKIRNFDELWHPLMIILIHIAPAIAAAFIGYAEKMALLQQSKRYSRMSQLLKNAGDNLKKSLDNNDFIRSKRILLKLGNEILIENGDWVLLHRERPMEVPVG